MAYVLERTWCHATSTRKIEPHEAPAYHRCIYLEEHEDEHRCACGYKWETT